MRLAEALKVNTSVTYIGLEDNNIGGVGLNALAEMLDINKKLNCPRSQNYWAERALK